MLVEIDIARLLTEIRILLRLLQQFVELAIQQLALGFLRGKRLLKRLLAPARFTFQFLHGGVQILNGRRLHSLFV